MMNGEKIFDVDINSRSPINPTQICETNDSVTNGLLSPPNTPSATSPTTDGDNQATSSPSGTGRMKFFKDGRFILELWHQKNGERNMWLPSSTKPTTIWPAAGNVTPQQESSTSFSVSDDNLSMQSSPYLREHCLKQMSPRKNRNSDTQFYMRAIKKRKKSLPYALIRRKRRRPFEAIHWPDEEKTATNHAPQKCYGRSKKIYEVVKEIWERKMSEYSNVFSPRKRILQEMEKVSLGGEQNLASKPTKKSRAKGSWVAPTASSLVASGAAPSNKSVGAHSITSILANKEEEQPSFLRNLLKSPSYRENCSSNSPTKDVAATPSSFLSSRSASPSPSIITRPQPILPIVPQPSYMSYHPVAPFLGSPPNPYYPFFVDPSSVWALSSSLPPAPLTPSTSRHHTINNRQTTTLPAYHPEPVVWVPRANASLTGYSVPECESDMPLNLSKNSG